MTDPSVRDPRLLCFPVRAASRGMAWGCVLATLAGCASPSPLGQQGERELRRAVTEAAAREVAQAQREGKPIVITREPGAERIGIRPQFMPELDAMAGPKAYDGAKLPLGEDLLGSASRTVVLNLERAVRTAVEHNIAVQFARVSPAISEAQVTSAQAAFDWTLFSTLTLNKNDSPRVASTQGGGSTNNLASTTTQSQAQSTLGVRRQLIGGGRFTVQQDFSFTDDKTRNQVTSPDPASQLSFTLQFDQPLLRGMGSEVSRAEVRVAQNAERNAVQSLKRDLMRTVADTEKTYWQLAQAHKELLIQQRLLERGEKVRDLMIARTLNDANSAQVADAQARVERRKADVLRAQTNLKNASDRLKALMNDPDLPVGSELIVLPADGPIDAPLRFSLLDSIRSAVQYRPEVQQAILGIDDASIRRLVADNQRLPDLQLRLQARTSSLEDSPGDAYGQVWDGRFIDYVAGLVFEVPIGNRRAESELRRRSLERMQTVIAYRNTVQQVTQEVKTSLDRIALNYRLITQTQAGRVAAANALRVLLIEQETTAGITPERLDLEFSRQEQLASAEREEVQALADYNVAITDLYLSMGTLLDRNQIRFIVPTAEDAPWRSGEGR